MVRLLVLIAIVAVGWPRVAETHPAASQPEARASDPAEPNMRSRPVDGRVAAGGSNWAA